MVKILFSKRGWEDFSRKYTGQVTKKKRYLRFFFTKQYKILVGFMFQEFMELYREPKEKICFAT